MAQISYYSAGKLILVTEILMTSSGAWFLKPIWKRNNFGDKKVHFLINCHHFFCHRFCHQFCRKTDLDHLGDRSCGSCRDNTFIIIKRNGIYTFLNRLWFWTRRCFLHWRICYECEQVSQLKLETTEMLVTKFHVGEQSWHRASMIEDIDDIKCQFCHQHLKLRTNIFRLQHLSPELRQFFPRVKPFEIFAVSELCLLIRKGFAGLGWPLTFHYPHMSHKIWVISW